MAHVLIGFAEALSAPEVVFSLLGAGHSVSAFARADSVKDLPLRHLPLQALHGLPAPETDAAGAADALAALMQQADAPDLVLPLDDSGLWITARAAIPSTRIAGASSEAVLAALDKTVQIEAAQAAGLQVPPTQILRTPDDCDRTDLPRPGLAKPALALMERAGGLGKGSVVYLEADTPAKAMRSALETSGPLLVQPLVQGVGEGVFGFVTDNGVTGWSGHRRVRMMNPHGSGSSACRRIVPDAALRTQVTDFLERLNWRGAFMVELLRDPQGVAWFMELNGRMWGSLALARRQGYEYPAWAVAQAIDPAYEPDPPINSPDPGEIRNLGRDILHLAFVLRGPKSDFHRVGWPSFARSAAAVLRPAPRRQFYNFDPNYPGFLWREAIWTVKRGLRR